MKIGVMADSHDRLPAIQELLKRFMAAGCGMVLHAGDFCSPFSLNPFLEANIPMAGIFGRNDGDPEGIRAQAARGIAIELYESPHSFEVAGRQILMVHEIADVGKRSVHKHDFVIHASSHQVEMKTRGNSIMLNPGEACGWLYGTPQAMIVDLETKKVDFVQLIGPEWSR